MAPRRKKAKKAVVPDTASNLESVDTPLTQALYEENLPDINTPEPIPDAQPVDLTPPPPVALAPLLRRDATSFEPADIERFTRMANNWYAARPYTKRRYPNYRPKYSKASYRVRRPYRRTYRPRYMSYARKKRYSGGYRYRY